MTMKTRLGVHQGHWNCHHSIERIRLPIDVISHTRTLFLMKKLDYIMQMNNEIIKSFYAQAV